MHYDDKVLILNNNLHMIHMNGGGEIIFTLTVKRRNIWLKQLLHLY